MFCFFHTACDSPGTLKLMSCSSTFTGLPVLVWSSSIFVSISSPLLWILIHLRVSPFLSGAWHPRDRTKYLSRFPLWTLAHLRVSPFLKIGFFVWFVGFVGSLCCFQRLLNLILSSNYLCRNLRWWSRWHIYFWFIFLLISSQLFSRYNKLGVYRQGWLRYILFDRTSILFVEQAVYRPNTPYPGVFSTSSACTMQDVVWSIKLLLIPVILIKEYSLSFRAWIWSSRYQSWICDGM